MDRSATAVAASCVLLGARAVLIRGRPGSGKSTLARRLVEAPAPFPFARLVADDGTRLRAAAGRLVAGPPETIAGRIEVRGLGLAAVPFEPCARVALVADLVPAGEVARLPDEAALSAELLGIRLPRVALGERDPLAAGIVRLAMSRIADGGSLGDFVP